MQIAFRPYIVAGMAVVGASLVAATFVAAPDGANHAVQLATAADPLTDIHWITQDLADIENIALAEVENIGKTLTEPHHGYPFLNVPVISRTIPSLDQIGNIIRRLVLLNAVEYLEKKRTLEPDRFADLMLRLLKTQNETYFLTQYRNLAGFVHSLSDRYAAMLWAGTMADLSIMLRRGERLVNLDVEALRAQIQEDLRGVLPSWYDYKPDVAGALHGATAEPVKLATPASHALLAEPALSEHALPPATALADLSTVASPAAVSADLAALSSAVSVDLAALSSAVSADMTGVSTDIGVVLLSLIP